MPGSRPAHTNRTVHSSMTECNKVHGMRIIQKLSLIKPGTKFATNEATTIAVLN